MVRGLFVTLSLILLSSNSLFAVKSYQETLKKVEKMLAEEASDPTSTSSVLQRENWVRLRKNGGIIQASRPAYGCKRMDEYAELMAFIMYGNGKEPDDSSCWSLKNGTAVRLVKGPICNQSNEVCKFKATGISNALTRSFFTSVHAINPN